MALQVRWIDDGREPRSKPDPNYPHGIDLDMSAQASGRNCCQTPLPYPAKRCGKYIVVCDTCGLRVIITTAGRPDDPRSLKVICKPS
jgi:hypothetical protein